jgi:hypothetical protein
LSKDCIPGFFFRIRTDPGDLGVDGGGPARGYVLEDRSLSMISNQRLRSPVKASVYEASEQVQDLFNFFLRNRAVYPWLLKVISSGVPSNTI